MLLYKYYMYIIPKRRSSKISQFGIPRKFSVFAVFEKKDSKAFGKNMVTFWHDIADIINSFVKITFKIINSSARENPKTNMYGEEVKITHMWRRYGALQNICLAFIDDLEKQLFIKNNDTVGQ